MKILGKYLKRVINENNNIELTFEVEDYSSKRLVEELQKDSYRLDISKIQSKKSLRQNNHLWALINEISSYNGQDDMEVYIQALEEANAKYKYLIGEKDVENELKKSFRAVKVVRPQEVNGKEFIVYKCFYGSSKFTKEEMMKLLDIVVGWAIELNIPINEDMYR